MLRLVHVANGKTVDRHTKIRANFLLMSFLYKRQDNFGTEVFYICIFELIFIFLFENQLLLIVLICIIIYSYNVKQLIVQIKLEFLGLFFFFFPNRWQGHF